MPKINASLSRAPTETLAIRPLDYSAVRKGPVVDDDNNETDDDDDDDDDDDEAFMIVSIVTLGIQKLNCNTLDHSAMGQARYGKGAI